MGTTNWQEELSGVCTLNQAQFFRNFDSPEENTTHEKLSLQGMLFFLSNLSLRNQVYKECNFSFSSFEGTDLFGSKFESCDLSYVNFSNTKLKGVCFIDTDVKTIDLGRVWNWVARLFGKRFVLQHIKGAKIESTKLPEEKTSSDQQLQLLQSTARIITKTGDTVNNRPEAKRVTRVEYLISKCKTLFNRSNEDQSKNCPDSSHPNLRKTFHHSV